MLTALFVPGDRPDRFDKAVRSGADAVIIDLEDAVAPDRKAGARAAAVDFLSRYRTGAVPVHVRVNALETAECAADLAALAGLPGLAGVRLPKGVTGQPVWAITSADTHVPAVGLITVGGRLYSFSSDDTTVAEVAGADDLSGNITTVAVAPDGRRLALVVAGRLWTAVLSTSGDGVQLMQPVQVLTAGLRRVSAVDWSSETWVTVAGDRTDRSRVAIFEMTADGTQVRPRLDDIGTEGVSYLAAYPVSPISGSDRADTVAYVAKGEAFDVLSGPVRIGVGELAVPIPNPPSGVSPTAPFFLR